MLCVSVCGRSHGWTVWHIIMIFSTRIDLDDILDKFDGQGHGLQVKVTRSKKRDFDDFLDWVLGYNTFAYMVWCYVTSYISYDVTVWHCDVMWHHNMTSCCHRRATASGPREVQQHFSVFCFYAKLFVAPCRGSTGLFWAMCSFMPPGGGSEIQPILWKKSIFHILWMSLQIWTAR